MKNYELHDELAREDLSHLYFTTIDSPSTQDMDDALFIEPISKMASEPAGV